MGALIGCLLLPGIGLLLIFNIPQTGGGLWERGGEQEDSDFQGNGEGDSCCRRQCTAYILLLLVTSYGLAFQFQEDVVWLLGEEMKKFEDVNGFVIDGFPANLNQGSIIHYSIEFPNRAINQQARWTLNRIEKILTGPSLGERACIRGSENILFEILD